VKQMQCHARESKMVFFALLLALVFSVVPAAGQGRFQLRELYPQEKIAQVLIPREQWRPWPKWNDRQAWEKLPEAVRRDLIANGEQHLGYDWPDLPATLFLQYAREGNRSRYEREHFARRYALTHLVFAECVEGKGRFLDDIANGVWAICEESFWGVPAHVGAQKAGSGLPDFDEPIVDLFAAETGESLAWTYYLVGEQLDKVSPLIRPRIRQEMDRRILTPCLTRDDFGWMGFAGGRVNNWNPWCNASWLTSTLLVEPDAERRVASVAKIVRSLDHFLDAYADDGGCDEGPGYWGRAGASLFDCLELLHSVTKGAVNVYDRPLIQNMGRYIYRVHIADDSFVNFADASAQAHPAAELVHRFGKRIGDDRMAAFGAYVHRRDPDKGFAGERDYTIGRYLAEVFHFAELEAAQARAPLPRDVWLDGIQVMVARCKEGTPQGYFVAAKGGHNAESHNHNDIGNFVVYVDGRPILIDIGVETYSRKTFSSQRYEIWTMQSAWHTLPTIDGVMQSPGRQFAARDVRCEADDEHAQLTLDIAGAYPKQANLKSWVRTVRLNRGRDVAVTEKYALEKPAKEITLSFVTPCRVRVQDGGRLLLETVDQGEPPLTVQVVYDGSKLKPVVETVSVEDGRLRSVWPERLTRILLKAEQPAQQDSWTVRIERKAND